MPVRRVVFDSTLYLAEAVEAAKEAYGEYASITLRPAPKGVTTTLTGDGVDDEIVDAFCNHVLFETVTRRRQAATEGK